MAAIASIADALRDARLFRGGRALAAPRAGLPSGIDALDDALPWAGFPRGALTELLHADDGVGEFSLLLPALRRLMQAERVALIAPPYLPYPPALAQAGLPLTQLVWISPPAERLWWVAEQCLRAGCLGGVLLWSERGDDRLLRRLQLAAEQGDTHAWLFRPLKHAANASPAALRLRVERERLEVVKCRGAVLLGGFGREADDAACSARGVSAAPHAVPPPPLAGEGRGGGDYGARLAAPERPAALGPACEQGVGCSADPHRVTAPYRLLPSPPPQAGEGVERGVRAAPLQTVRHAGTEHSEVAPLHAVSPLAQEAERNVSAAPHAVPPPLLAGEGRGGGDDGAWLTAPIGFPRATSLLPSPAGRGAGERIRADDETGTATQQRGEARRSGSHVANSAVGGYRTLTPTPLPRGEGLYRQRSARNAERQLSLLPADPAPPAAATRGAD
jgi:hypothetical protein